ncbi:MAG: hypothetical protein KAS58_01395, partial [Calditrichia bacterium]|nr:hypothetical protein [Calditrichia bacterium]
WEDYGWIGGDGFSWRDGVAGSIAAVGSYAIDKWVFPFIKNNMLPKNDLIIDQIEYTMYPNIYRQQVRLDINLWF